MSHNYFFDLQRHLEKRLEEERRLHLRQDLPDPDRRRSAGRLEALAAFQGFLARTLHPRLPKRLARKVQAETRPEARPESKVSDPGNHGARKTG